MSKIMGCIFWQASHQTCEKCSILSMITHFGSRGYPRWSGGVPQHDRLAVQREACSVRQLMAPHSSATKSYASPAKRGTPPATKPTGLDRSAGGPKEE